MISKKELEILISRIESFAKPNAELEQYQTPSNLAAEILWNAFMNEDIKGRTVVDLGTGTGIFAIGASLLGAKLVVGYDIDSSAITMARKNIKTLKKSKAELGKITFQKSEIAEVKKKYDTVFMNPPFGVQKKHADRDFLEKAFSTAKKAVYSIHKAGPQNDKFIEGVANEHCFLSTKLGERAFVLKATMPFHERQKYPVSVALWRFIAL